MTFEKTYCHFTYSKLILSSIFFLFWAGCSTHSTFDKEKELMSLVTDLRLAAKNRQVIVIFSGGCSPCKDQTIAFLKKIDSKNAYKPISKTIIVPKSEKEIVNSLKQTNIRVVIDRDYLLEKFGFHLSSSSLIELNKESKIVFWEEINTKNLYKIREHFGI